MVVVALARAWGWQKTIPHAVGKRLPQGSTSRWKKSVSWVPAEWAGDAKWLSGQRVLNRESTHAGRGGEVWYTKR